MKKVRISSVLISACIILTIFAIALNFSKRKPIFSYILEPKDVFAETDITTETFFEDDVEEITPITDLTEQNAEEPSIEEKQTPQIPEKEHSQVQEPEEISTNSENINKYYYTKSGTKFHLDKNCRYLKNSKEIFEDTLDSIDSNKLSACSACAKDYIGKNETPQNTKKEQKAENDTSIYYYTTSGTKWHTDKNCRYLKNSKNIFEGDYETVGKKGLSPCSNCGK